MSRRVIWLEDEPQLALDLAQAELQNGGAVVFPTDTVYGLLAWPWAPAAYQAVYALKGREFNRPLALLASREAVDKILVSEAEVLLGLGGDYFDTDLHLGFESGNATVIFNPDALYDLPDVINETQPGTVGLRCPNRNYLQALLTVCGDYVWATSVNRSGQPPATAADEVLAWVEEVEGNGGEPPALVVLSHRPGSGAPSSVIDLTGDEPKRLR